MSATTMRHGPTIDIAEAIDTGPWTGMQKMVVCLAALAVILDGFDSQLIGYAIPALIKDWGLPRSAFTPVVAAGLIGMSLGSACAGVIADRIGRRAVILGSVAVFGIATALIGFAPGIATMTALRFVAGLGIGGGLPSSTTLTAEFTPARRRTLAITATIVCVPLGGMLAGLYAGQVLPAYGWRMLFMSGGALPVGFFLLLFAALPESPRYLARRTERWPDLVRLLGRMARSVPRDAKFGDKADPSRLARPALGSLFEGDRRRDTVALWVSFFLCLLAVYSAFSWLPTMLNAAGLDVKAAGAGLTAYNLGGVLGALLCAQAINLVGSRVSLVGCALAAALCAFLLEFVDIGQTVVLIVGLGAHGLFVNAVQSTLYAVAAHVYPTSVRATGTASALAFGRLGAILSAFVGAGVISAAGPGSFLTVLGLAMLGAAVSLLVLKHHIPPMPRVAASTVPEHA